MDWSDLGNEWGPAGAVVLGMAFIVNRFLVFMGNHLSAQTEAMTDLVGVVAAMKAKVDDCPERGRRDG